MNNSIPVNLAAKSGPSVYISLDMEGVSGVVAPADVWEFGPEFERARHWLTAEVNAAIQGALDGGAGNILVNDAHMYMRNIVLEKLNTEVSFIRGSRKPGFMTQGLESEKFDMAFFVGYHSMAGTQDGVLCHTFSDQWAALAINDCRIGEIAYNALYASAYGCIVALVSGDASLESEVSQAIPWAHHIIVKCGIGRFAARSLTLHQACQRIYQGARLAMEQWGTGQFHLYQLEYPASVSVKFNFTDKADIAQNIPGVARQSALEVAYTANSFDELHRTLMCILNLTN